LIKIFNHHELKSIFAFRGGPALNKLFFNPPSRYSEDIDLVQIKNTKIGDVIGNEEVEGSIPFGGTTSKYNIFIGDTLGILKLPLLLLTFYC
jgi:hypothetical protein